MEYAVPRAAYRHPPPSLPFLNHQNLSVRQETPPYFNNSSSLLIRHLPEDYSYGEVENFLCGLGAKTVKYFGATGRLRNIAIAEFDSPASAIFVMQKLHQIKLRKRRLVVEFADEHLKKYYPDYATPKKSPIATYGPSGRPETQEPERNRHTEQKNFYKYPNATPSILSNVMNALAEVPSLYIQVLNLMNEMNLPVPFGPAKHPEIVEEAIAEIPMEVSSGSSSESEIEEETTENCRIAKKIIKLPRQEKQRKKLKMAAFFEPIDSEPRQVRQEIPIQTLFDQQKFRDKNSIKIQVSNFSNFSRNSEIVEVEEISQAGFGKICPQASSDNLLVASSEEFISEEELLRNRISQEEMATVSVFNNYSAGTPSAKLYVKNLAKAVNEEDLRFIFGRYVNWQSERERSGFNIRLMVTGRMKGQAFITMPSQIKAEIALQEVNGYVLQGKPIVVTFSRSKDSSVS